MPAIGDLDGIGQRPRDPDTTQRATVVGLMPTYVRSWALARELTVETLPASATHLLGEWEASLGLPR